jgi:FkbM family methyltransferase
MRSIKKLVPQRLKLFVLARLASLRRLAVGRKTRALLVESNQGPLLVGVEDMQVGRKLSSEGVYSSAELTRLLALVTAQSDVLVLGGHVGALAIPLSKACRSLTVMEPNPDTYRLLELNLLINSCHNVRALNLAAGDKREKLSFLASKTNSGGSKRLPVHRDYRYFYDQPDVISVAADRLDDVFPGSSFDVIVMDIEGSEYFALQGMPRLLASARILAMEFVPHHLTYVAGVSVSEFVDRLEPFFDQLFIPGKDLTVHKEQFQAVLQQMFDKEEIEEGLIFSKES